LDNRFYLQALGVTGLFIILFVLVWIATEGRASEADIRNANNTRTAIAMTGSYLLQPRTRTPSPLTPTSASETRESALTSTSSSVPSPTNTSLLAQLNSPMPSLAPSFTPLPTQTAVAQIPVFTGTPFAGQLGTKAAPEVPQSATPSLMQAPAEFVRWYFTRVWNERDYQNLWDNYLTISFKANVGSGLFGDYVVWWDSVARVDVNAVDVLENNGRDAWVRVNLTFQMKDGRVVQNQVYEYDLLYDPSRDTWMFDAGS
jgi:hypothetical protein